MSRPSLARKAMIAASTFAVIASAGVASVTTAAAAPRIVAPKTIAASGAHTIRAIETEYHVALSRMSIPAGRYTITAVNKGHVQHGLIVNGPGVPDKLIGIVKPGHSASKVITLRKGTYDVFCPLSNHKMRGMDTHLTVS